jgi:hypothetical protein
MISRNRNRGTTIGGTSQLIIFSMASPREVSDDRSKSAGTCVVATQSIDRDNFYTSKLRRLRLLRTHHRHAEAWSPPQVGRNFGSASVIGALPNVRLSRSNFSRRGLKNDAGNRSRSNRDRPRPHGLRNDAHEVYAQKPVLQVRTLHFDMVG